jgi:hypothetical protein
VKLRTKIAIASAVCVFSFVLVVVLVFTAPHAVSFALAVGFVSGFRAATWSRQAKDEGAAQGIHEVRLKKGSVVRFFEWAALVLVLIGLLALAVRQLIAK